MRKIVIVIFFCSLFFLPCSNIANAYEKEIKALSSALAESIVISGKKSLAVVDFTDLQGNVTELGRFLSEEFSVALSESGKRFEVVDRSQLNNILKEQKFALSGLVDPKTIQKLGAIAGVECLITGTLTPFGDSIRLAVKVLDVSTARVIGGSRGDIAKTKAIEELLTKGIDTTLSTISKTSKTSPVLSTNSAKSKNVGMITVTFKRIEVSRNEIRVALDFLNRSNDDLKLALNGTQAPHMVDEEGTRYDYNWLFGGVHSVNPNYGVGSDIDRATILSAQSNNNVWLKFQRSMFGGGGGNVGSNFELSLPFIIYDPQKKSTSIHQVKLSDLNDK